jgi:hypothetical protein
MDAARRRTGDSLLAGAAVVAVGGVCALAVHHGCFHPPPPVDLPDPGTPRARYCGAVVASKPWILLTIAPALVTAFAGMLLPRRAALVLVVLAVCAVLVANAYVANSLTSALTI